MSKASSLVGTPEPVFRDNSRHTDQLGFSCWQLPQCSLCSSHGRPVTCWTFLIRRFWNGFGCRSGQGLLSVWTFRCNVTALCTHPVTCVCAHDSLLLVLVLTPFPKRIWWLASWYKNTLVFSRNCIFLASEAVHAVPGLVTPHDMAALLALQGLCNCRFLPCLNQRVQTPTRFTRHLNWIGVSIFCHICFLTCFLPGYLGCR